MHWGSGNAAVTCVSPARTLALGPRRKMSSSVGAVAAGLRGWSGMREKERGTAPLFTLSAVSEASAILSFSMSRPLIDLVLPPPTCSRCIPTLSLNPLHRSFSQARAALDPPQSRGAGKGSCGCLTGSLAFGLPTPHRTVGLSSPIQRETISGPSSLPTVPPILDKLASCKFGFRPQRPESTTSSLSSG